MSVGTAISSSLLRKDPGGDRWEPEGRELAIPRSGIQFLLSCSSQGAPEEPATSLGTC